MLATYKIPMIQQTWIMQNTEIMVVSSSLAERQGEVKGSDLLTNETPGNIVSHYGQEPYRIMTTIQIERYRATALMVGTGFLTITWHRVTSHI